MSKPQGLSSSLLSSGGSMHSASPSSQQQRASPLSSSSQAGGQQRPSSSGSSSSGTGARGQHFLNMSQQQQQAVGPGATQSKALVPARMRLTELFNHWAQLPATNTLVSRLIDETLSEIQPAAGRGRDLSAASPPIGASTGNPRSHAESREQTPASRQQTPAASVAVSMDDLDDLGGFSLGTTPAASPSHPNTGSSGSSNAAQQGSRSTAATAPQQGGHSGPSSNNSSATDPEIVTTQATVTPPRKDLHAPHATPPTKTPREGATKRTNANLLQPHVAHNVDEMDTVHRLGALSPRSVSPGAVPETQARSPFDAGLGTSPRVKEQQAAHAFVLDGRSVSPQPHGGGSDSEQNTPRRPTRRAPSALAQSFDAVPAARVPVATAEDIPRFYFPRGRPEARSQCLVDDTPGGAPDTPAGSVAPKAAAQRREEAELAAMGKAVARAAAKDGAGTPTAQKRGSTTVNGRLTSAGAGKRPGTADTAAATAQAVATITTDVYHLPNVFIPLVAARIVKQPGHQLLATAVRSLYDTLFAGQTDTRRMFEILIGTSPNAPAVDKRTGGGKRRNYLVKEDFTAMMLAIVEQHPGLAFLRDSPDFQPKYVETVILRIMYALDPFDTGRITWDSFIKSELPDAIRAVSETDDINTVLEFFSYEHFYVLYCRFWDLDTDKDLQISAADLERYFNEGTANSLVIERVFAGVGRKLSAKMRGRMTYEDFVYFCLSEEDKATPRAIRFWFRILDTDGDGVLSGYELNSFYEQTRQRLEQIAGEAIGFTEVMNQIADMLTGPTGGAEIDADVADLSTSVAPVQRPANVPAAPERKVGLTGLDLLHVVRSPQKNARHDSLTSAQTAAATKEKPPRHDGSGNALNRSGRSDGAQAASSAVADAARVGFTLGELLRRPMAACVAINMITNVVKFIQFEQRDPFVVQHERMQGAPERNDWDRFCRAEYDRMSATDDE